LNIAPIPAKLGHQGEDDMRISILSSLAAVAVIATAGVSHAAPFRKEHCQVEVPADWTQSKTRAARADKKVWVGLLEAPTAAEAVSVEASLKAEKVSEDAGKIVMVSTASAGGQTNKQYHVITKTTPSCVADATAPAGPDEALAKQVGLSVKVAK
jgi:hypothetical protein